MSRVPAYPELAAAIARTGISHADIATRADIATATVSHILHGRVRPSSALRERIAGVLGQPAAELFKLNPDVQRLVDLALEQGLAEHVESAEAVARVAALIGGQHDVAA